MSTNATLAIPNGTEVPLRLMSSVSSANAHVGDPLDFVVEKDVAVGEHVVLPAGTVVQGEVLQAKRRHMLGIAGKVVVGLDSVDLATGETLALHARREAKGHSRVKRMLAEMAVTAVIHLPAAPVFLLTRGSDGVMLKDTEMIARVECAPEVQAASLPPPVTDSEQLDLMLKNLPPRVMNRLGREGDMVNLVFIAQESDLQAAFANGGWVKTDPWKPVALWHIAKYRSHDARIPMAEFYMFGRMQDYGYALPDPEAMIRRRHHIRIWKTQYTMDEVPIWVGAASYDAALEYGKSGHLVNHNIDPHVDTERDFVGDDIAEHKPQRLRYLRSMNPVTEAETTTGQTYWSDSRLLLVDLHAGSSVIASLPPAANPSVRRTAVAEAASATTVHISGK